MQRLPLALLPLLPFLLAHALTMAVGEVEGVEGGIFWLTEGVSQGIILINSLVYLLLRLAVLVVVRGGGVQWSGFPLAHMDLYLHV
jgi:hypothetical protein